MEPWIRGGLVVVLAGLLSCTVKQRAPRPAPPGGEVALRVPPDSEIPPGPLGVAIRRGRALLRDTRDSLPQHAASALRCFSCHLGEGAQLNALPLVGVYSRFPEYRSRNDLVNLLEDRVNDCFERSLNGKSLARDGADMRDIVAYLAFLSRGVAPPGDIPGGRLRLLEPLPPDTGRGRSEYSHICARCHGPDGGGTPLAPPLWGPRSFNIGAGLARLNTAAAFIRENMPFDRAVVLSDQQAFDIAAYLVSQPRPDFAAKARDWPRGGAPPDVPYPLQGEPRVRPSPQP